MQLSRRQMLQLGAAAPLAPPAAARPRIMHHAAKAKRVIFMHMVGAPSQIDLFDPKPILAKFAHKSLPDSVLKNANFAFISRDSSALPSPWEFKRYGRRGTHVSSLLPHFQKVVDDVCIVRSMHTHEFNHPSGELVFHTGFGQLGRPSLGAWVDFALGSANPDLPSNIVMCTGGGSAAGTATWGTGFLPTQHQGVRLRGSGDPVLFLTNPDGINDKRRRIIMDAARRLNELQYKQARDAETQTRIAQTEMAIRMQKSVPELVDLRSESQATLDLYGVEPNKPSFARHCLLARRLAERGVRFIQLMDGDWDHHGQLKQDLPTKCAQVDQGMSALVQDLGKRGLLDDTLVVWGGEFGRTPLAQKDDGRDHHKDGFTMWLAGGGIKAGMDYGATDDFGFNVAQDPVHVHDLHATILHLLGIDHERLTYKFQGRDFRLTDVAGRVVRPILA
ncbi:MAG: DUF1501 domain-containing protein [Deltaproteobacteria bacterium]|nr:DUF1501 domain-containing protein [Deltaproteobacteria bacterium]